MEEEEEVENDADRVQEMAMKKRIALVHSKRIEEKWFQKVKR